MSGCEARLLDALYPRYRLREEQNSLDVEWMDEFCSGLSKWNLGPTARTSPPYLNSGSLAIRLWQGVEEMRSDVGRSGTTRGEDRASAEDKGNLRPLWGKTIRRLPIAHLKVVSLSASIPLGLERCRGLDVHHGFSVHGLLLFCKSSSVPGPWPRRWHGERMFPPSAHR